MLLTEDEAKKRKLKGVTPNKTKLCDLCGGVVGSFHYITRHGKDADTQECRELLEEKAGFKKLGKEKGSTMKKDEAKKKKKETEEVVDDAVPETDDEIEDDEQPVKKTKTAATKPPDEDDEDEEETKSAKSKKSDTEEDDEEEDDEPKAKAKPAAKEAKAAKPKKAAATDDKKKSGKKPLKPYRKGSQIYMLFERLSDSKWHVKGELFKRLNAPELPLARLQRHAKRHGWNFQEKGDQVKMSPPASDVKIALGKAA